MSDRARGKVEQLGFERALWRRLWRRSSICGCFPPDNMSDATKRAHEDMRQAVAGFRCDAVFVSHEQMPSGPCTTTVS